MRYFETPGPVQTNRALIDLREARDDLSIQISILKKSDRIDPAALSTLRYKLGLLEVRIAEHEEPIYA
jgi:hypothetical protein